MKNERLTEEMRNKFQIDNKKVNNNLKISLQKIEDERRQEIGLNPKKNLNILQLKYIFNPRNILII